MTTIERAYLWAACLIGIILIERRAVDRILRRAEGRYWARKGR